MRLILVISICLAVSSDCLAQPFIEHLSPPVLQRGQTTRITLHGSDARQSLQLWTTLPAGLIDAKFVNDAPEAATFDVNVAPTAPLGMHGLRLATRSGLSNAVLFFVDDLPVSAVSPGTTPLPVKLPICVTGTCRSAAVDRFEIDVAAGEAVTFEVVGNRFGKDYDPLVRIRDASGRLIVERDNDPGLFFDSRFSHTFTSAGKYLVEIRDSRFAGNPTWHYALRMGRFPEARIAVPAVLNPGRETAIGFPQIPGYLQTLKTPADPRSLFAHVEIRRPDDQAGAWLPVIVTPLAAGVEAEPNATWETATIVKAPGVFCGVLGTPRDEDWFGFALQAGQQLDVKGIARLIGSPADLELTLFGPDKNEMNRVDDNNMEEGTFTFTAGKAGEYRLLVRDVSRQGGAAFGYAVEVAPSQPRFKVTADISAVTLPQRTWQPLPLKIIRTNFNGPIDLTLIGAPPGVTLEPTTIPAEAVEFVCRLNANDMSPQGVSSFQIAARGTVAPTKPTDTPLTIDALVRTTPLIDRQLKNVDLIPYALREDQTNLPPSLTDRFALMISPPAPFTVELPESLLVLPRFQTARFPIVTTRIAGFTSPVTFRAEGGQIGSEKEERNQVYLRSTAATPAELAVSGVFHNRILTNLNKHRVDLFATAEQEGHTVTLMRTFTLDVKSVFSPTIEPSSPVVEPGATIKLTVAANRLPTFDGPITITPYVQTALTLPVSIEIPAGKPTVELELKVPKETAPNRYQIRFTASGFVGKYEESLDPPAITVEVKKPPEPKK